MPGSFLDALSLATKRDRLRTAQADAHRVADQYWLAMDTLDACETAADQAKAEFIVAKIKERYEAALAKVKDLDAQIKESQ